jgi:hypothetical protein
VCVCVVCVFVVCVQSVALGQAICKCLTDYPLTPQVAVCIEPRFYTEMPV